MYNYNNLANLFYDVVDLNKNKIALNYKNKKVNYDQLNKLSNKIANFFLSKGVKKNDVIAIFNTKEIFGYASMLACLKIGVIYTNLDTENPIKRLKKIFEISKPKLIVIDHKPNNKFNKLSKNLKYEFIFFSNHKFIKNFSHKNLIISKKITGSNPAYIMFTSGSTGFPKGALISHANILSFIRWSINNYDITNKDIFAQVSPMYFDNSVFDFFTAFFSGACLVPVNKKLILNLSEFLNVIHKSRCSIFFCVPSFLIYLQKMKVLNKKTFTNVRSFIFGGEGFPKAELKKFYNIYCKQAKIINVYGPTETTCICSSYQISKKDFENMKILAPLGKINSNFDKIIVDENMNKVKKGMKGELCLIGPNVCLGYYNDSRKTNENFIQNPNIKTYKDIIYKSGDIVYEKDEILYFVGRKDNQIKHMGHRIELEEIEAVLNSFKYINQCAVVYKKEKINYGEIIAHVVSIKKILETRIKKDLEKHLPRYMIPNLIYIKKKLPKNRNGKIDRSKL